MKLSGNLIFILTLIFSCNPFLPEEPGSGGKEEFNPPVTSSDVITNFLNAVNNKNISNYRTCFDQANFMFIPDPYDTLEEYKEILKQWNFDIEIEVMDRIFSLTSDSTKTLSLRMETISQDSLEEYTIFYENYEIYIESDKNYYARGKLSFTIQKNHGFWYITQWKDFKGDTTDWGEIKAIFYAK